MPFWRKKQPTTTTALDNNPTTGPTFIAIDVETANTDPSSICQIGIAIYANGVLYKSYGHLINPKCTFSPTNIGIHGITARDVKKAPTFKEAFPPFAELLSGYTVVSHTMFDRNAFQKACALSNHNFPKLDWVDSSMIARRAWSDIAQRGYGLQNICDRIDFDYDAHDAEQDAIACGAVVLAALDHTSWTFEQAITHSRTRNDYFKWAGKTVAAAGNQDGEHYGKLIVFTGDLPISRADAAKLAAEKGYETKKGMSQKIDYLIMGANGEGTGKHIRASTMQKNGHEIEILDWKGFFEK